MRVGPSPLSSGPRGPPSSWEGLWTEAALPSALGRRRGRRAGSPALAELVPRRLSGLLAQGPSSVPFRSGCARLPASPGRPGAWSRMDPSPERAGPAGPLQTRSADSTRLGTDWPVVETWLCRACVQALLLRDPGFLRAPGSLTSPGASRNPRKPQPVGRPASALTPPGVLPSGHLTRTFHAARSLPWSLPFTAKAQAEASAGGAAPGGAGRGRTWAGQGWKVQEGLPRLSVTLVAPTWPLALQAVPVSLRVTPISLQAMSCLSCVTTWFPERGLPGS